MIAKPLVLVLGAGASAPYGFPTGWGLTQQIITGLDPAEGHLYKILTQECDFDDPQVKHFREDFDASGHHSVDAFLEHRPDHLAVGKAAIAASLIPFENLKQFSRILTPEKDGRWYSYLLQHLDTNPDNFLNNALTIITFNYDRSLEYYLFQALMSRHKLDYREAGELVQDLQILHVYGSLCAPDFYRGPTPKRGYEADVSRRKVLGAADQIQIIPEARTNTPVFKWVSERIANADTVCFVGFGFDEINMRRLGVRSSIKKIHFVGTGYELSDDNANFARAYLTGHGYEHIEIHQGHDALWVMQNAGVFS